MTEFPEAHFDDILKTSFRIEAAVWLQKTYESYDNKRQEIRDLVSELVCGYNPHHRLDRKEEVILQDLMDKVIEAKTAHGVREKAIENFKYYENWEPEEGRVYPRYIGNALGK